MDTPQLLILAPEPDKTSVEISYLESVFDPSARQMVHTTEDACAIIRRGTCVVMLVLTHWKPEMVKAVLSAFPKAILAGFCGVLLSQQDIFEIPVDELMPTPFGERENDVIWTRPIMSTKHSGWQQELVHYISQHNQAIAYQLQRTKENL